MHAFASINACIYTVNIYSVIIDSAVTISMSIRSTIMAFLQPLDASALKLLTVKFRLVFFWDMIPILSNSENYFSYIRCKTETESVHMYNQLNQILIVTFSGLLSENRLLKTFRWHRYFFSF